MAREEDRCRCFGASNARRRGGPRRIPLPLVLCTLLVGSLAVAAAAEIDGSYYHYSVFEGRSPVDSRSSPVKLMDGDAHLARRRRETPDKSVVTTEQKDDPKDHQAQQSQQPPPEQQAQQVPGPQPPQQPQQQQQEQKPQQPPAQPSKTTNTTSSHEDVTYSRDASSTPSSVEALDVKPDPKKKVAVSQPMNPATEDAAVPQTPHIWANRTMWSNVTSNDKEWHREDGKNQAAKTKVTELTPVAVDTTEEDKTESDIGDISISKFSDVTNTTLKQNNITRTVYDTHQYYNSTFTVDANICKKYWVDMDNHPELKVNHLLSQSHRRAATVKLKFDFPFYGHKVRNITIATGGFLYTGEYVHSWLAATQYIAPLMANFDTRLSNDSYVKYADNGTAFTVEWEKVVLQDKPDGGAFTFQVTLHQNGDIVFVYSVIPVVVEQIEDRMHPVKVGLSDAYIMDRTVFFVRRKTIYEYHRVNFNRQDIMNCTVIYLRALPTCLDIDNCQDCLTKVPEFDCKWCSELNQCSTGTFRSRQDWVLKGCEVRNVKEGEHCPDHAKTFKGEEYDHDGRVHPEEAITANEMSAKQERPDTSALESSRGHMNMSVSGIIGILTIVALLVGLAGWGAYAYRNPHSASGQMLIRYRPSQWSWRRGEARYTAATIHM
ncbi:PREDICTED: plexin domain-containing protein 2 [Dinoponera quadriceps]|uniref:Plexin domain-containing protein 2 n=1 Tax=Dinoponera quadriceps TaxID=609295 RepID=A0A6P3X7T9_DINQU|nr:PREDICTED: plexin domain-containing protein 2 [Dinoponera quadriceps]